MKKLELSPRLQMVADLVPQGLKLADVGTDHAYLPAALLLEGKIPSAIAADLREGPLSRAKLTAAEYGLEKEISFCLCNGLAGIRPEDTDSVSIAGMGGETIREILKAAPWTRERNIPLILQPMSTMSELRLWLTENGYVIEREALAQEGDTLYTAWLVQAGEMKALTEAELCAGVNSCDPLRGLWLDKWLQKIEIALRGVSLSQSPEAGRKKEELENMKKGLLEMKEEWKSWQ